MELWSDSATRALTTPTNVEPLCIRDSSNFQPPLLHVSQEASHLSSRTGTRHIAPCSVSGTGLAYWTTDICTGGGIRKRKGRRACSLWAGGLQEGWEGVSTGVGLLITLYLWLWEESRAEESLALPWGNLCGPGVGGVLRQLVNLQQPSVTLCGKQQVNSHNYEVGPTGARQVEPMVKAQYGSTKPRSR